jgi:hypothetical protein
MRRRGVSCDVRRVCSIDAPPATRPSGVLGGGYAALRTDVHVGRRRRPRHAQSPSPWIDWQRGAARQRRTTLAGHAQTGAPGGTAADRLPGHHPLAAQPRGRNHASSRSDQVAAAPTEPPRLELEQRGAIATPMLRSRWRRVSAPPSRAESRLVFGPDAERRVGLRKRSRHLEPGWRPRWAPAATPRVRGSGG